MTDTVFDTWECPEDAGVSSAGLIRFLDAWEQVRDRVQFHSMILLRHGAEVFRLNFAPYSDRTAHMLFSLSKSFTSAAAGFAVSEGKLSWGSSVTDVLPEEIPEGREEELRGITLQALLCMGSGLAPESDSPSPDPEITWARHVLSHPVIHPPMTHFHYNSFGTYLVSCMIQKAVGQTVRDYLVPRLFEPLGIGVPEWDLSPQGVCCGGFGLHLDTEGIARFGQCLLCKGMWNGKQVLPEGWVDLATREHIANYEGERQAGNEWAQGYGYQFWRCLDGRFRGDGAMGQACIVDPERDAVLAVTCGTEDMGEEFRLIRELLFPALDAPAGTEEDQREFLRRAGGLGYPCPEDDGSDQPLPEGEYGASFQKGECRVRMEAAPLDQIRITLRFSPTEEIPFYLIRGRAGLCTMVYSGGRCLPYFGCYAWQGGKLRIWIRSLEGPDTMDGTFTWTGEELIFDGTGVDFPSGHAVFFREKEAL